MLWQTAAIHKKVRKQEIDIVIETVEAIVWAPTEAKCLRLLATIPEGKFLAYLLAKRGSDCKVAPSTNIQLPIPTPGCQVILHSWYLKPPVCRYQPATG